MTKRRMGFLAGAVFAVAAMIATQVAFGKGSEKGGEDSGLKGNNWAMVTDYTLFDTTGPVETADTGAACGGNKAFIFYLHVRAVGAPALVRITFHDGGVIFIPLATDQEVDLTQAAGGTHSSDDLLTVTRDSGQIAGWASIQTQSGAVGAYAPSFCVGLPHV